MCHKGHDVHFEGRGKFFCDCGSGQVPDRPCKCMPRAPGEPGDAKQPDPAPKPEAASAPRPATVTRAVSSALGPTVAQSLLQCVREVARSLAPAMQQRRVVVKHSAGVRFQSSFAVPH